MRCKVATQHKHYLLVSRSVLEEILGLGLLQDTWRLEAVSNEIRGAAKETERQELTLQRIETPLPLL